MNRAKAWVRAFFGLSRRETRAFIILLPLMLVSVFITPAYRHWKATQRQDFSKEAKELDSLLAQWKWEERDDSIKQKTEYLPFTFNPNTASREEFIKLGFSESVTTRIDNYRTKKGRFTIKSDLLKIYGMDSILYTRLFAYIDLPVTKTVREKESNQHKTIVTSPSKQKFDINQADTIQLIRIYGIGSKLSLRILKYRNQLGGFISMDQLREVYGLDTAVVNELNQEAFVAENFKPVQVSINAATEQEMAAHPYIKYSLAKAIATYRFQHGKFESVEDLKKIAIVDEAFYNRIKPYLSINP